jgi:peptidoglycan/LPS O-acetylase OafA/YrhL
LDRRLFLLNGLAIIAVVINHAAGWGYTDLIWWAHRYLPVDVPYNAVIGSLPYYALLLLKQLTVFAVPAFLFVSGVFIAYAARTSQGNITWKVIRSRIMALLIPYLIWSLFAFVVSGVLGQTYSLLEYAQRLLLGQAIEAYFYIPLLVQFYLLTPWLVPLAQKRPIRLLVAAAVIQWGIIAFSYITSLGFKGVDHYQIIPFWAFVRWIFFFAIGIVYGFHMQAFKAGLQRFRVGIIAILCIATPLAVIEPEWLYRLTGVEGWRGIALTISTSLYALSVLAAFVAFAQPNMRFSKGLTQLGNKSYGIYLIHPKTLELAARGLYHLTPFILSTQLLFQPVLIAVGLGLPLLLMEIVARTPLQRIYRYLFG